MRIKVFIRLLKYLITIKIINRTKCTNINVHIMIIIITIKVKLGEIQLLEKLVKGRSTLDHKYFFSNSFIVVVL